jgi:tetratricopeptide (TPR) repeat protein
MSLANGDRRWARWLGVLIVLVGTTYILFRTVSTTEWRPRQPPTITVVTPQIVRVNNVDPAALLQQILVGGRIDEGALADIEKRGIPSLTAAAEFAAARYEHEHNRDEQALNYIQRAVASAPLNASLQTWYAMLLLNTGQTDDAVAHAEQAAQLEPDSADVQRILGQTYYQAGRLEEAVTAWERSLQLSPDEKLSMLLEKTKREAAVEGSFAKTGHGHFVLRYEGGKPADALSDDLFHTLEHDYDDLSADLGVTPKSPVTVVFYSAQQFSGVTKSPTWVGALNDGKMRIPLGEISSITPQLESVLRHELTHSFVHAAVPNCPVWLNEGLAQLEEPKSLDVLTASLGRQAASSEFVPLSQLEGSFQGMTSEQAQRAYFESLASVEYLRSAYGMDGLRNLLGKLADGAQPEAALHAVTGGSYNDLDEDTKAYTAKRNTSDKAAQ